jgi:5-(carboxyamino)imidazole ribonucleotide synthase
MILPDATLGMLGGGQLGRMFTLAAHSMGYRVMVHDPDPASPAGVIADYHLQAEFDDPDALRKLVRECAAVTTEFENIPAASLRYLADHCPTRPAAECVAIAQDRSREKAFFTEAGLQVAPYAVINSADDFNDISPNLVPGILKLSRLGYDGKGQVRVATLAEAVSAFESLGRQACVLEQLQDLSTEVSVIVARRADGEIRVFPVAENQHANGILDVSIVPARVSLALQDLAQQHAVRIAERMSYCGVLGVEFFLLRDGRLLVNEIAPRPHNSGHYTIDACVTSQFEQQVRTLCDLPLGDTTLQAPVVMVNLLGDLWHAGTPPWQRVWEHPRAKLHLYGKREARPGRKMGHYTCPGEYADAALQEALAIKQALLSPP